MLAYGICSEVDGPRVCHTEWSRSEREKQIPYAGISLLDEKSTHSLSRTFSNLIHSTTSYNLGFGLSALEISPSLRSKMSHWPNPIAHFLASFYSTSLLHLAGLISSSPKLSLPLTSMPTSFPASLPDAVTTPSYSLSSPSLPPFHQCSCAWESHPYSSLSSFCTFALSDLS